jgi:chorismate synthase
MIRLITAGESHGKSLVGIVEGLPAGLEISRDFIDLQLRRRQAGHGRGERMQIEKDRIEIVAGVRHGKTLGSPVSFSIENRDWSAWMDAMNPEPVAQSAEIRSVTRPRPGHADLAGSLKYLTHDARDILERASARETAARVASGSLCLLLLRHFGIRIGSHVLAIGKQCVPGDAIAGIEEILNLDPEDPVRCLNRHTASSMMAEIDEARASGDTLGGVLEVVASGVPPGMGTHIQWDRKLDGKIAQALMSIPSVKGVEIGTAFSAASERGSGVHDEIFYSRETKRFYHGSNRAGGIEGGITNGEDIRARVFLKPVPTLRKPLGSVDLQSKETFEAVFERSDTCVVPAAGVVAESMLGYILADAFLEKFGGDSMLETGENYHSYLHRLQEF